ncbi:MAG: UDP-N-acetylmuramoyl-L-alanine--D-glutamate ligase [Deltaproteobacteria bacterium]
MGGARFDLGRVVILGAGETGMAAARLVSRLGARARVVDDHRDLRTDRQLAAVAEPLMAGDAAGCVDSATLVIPSPGVPSSHPLLQRAQAAGVKVVSEIEFAAAMVDGPVLAVTGTNGKSTTVTLLAMILEEAGYRVFSGGNLGPPLSDGVGAEVDYFVVEVSSFQLEWARGFRPATALLLNIGDDHADRHGGPEAYAAVKLGLLANLDAGARAVVGRDGDCYRQARACSPAALSSFGFSPLDPGCRGMLADRAGMTLSDGEGWKATIKGEAFSVPHTLANLAAAAEVARGEGVSAGPVERAAARFKPLNHRLQLVAEAGGVEFWNDSKATNVAATLSSLEAFDRPVVVLLGGTAKGADLWPLAASACKIKAAVVFGQARRELREVLAGRTTVREADCFDDAFRRALDAASTGDVVLLAPACASWDEFDGYAERGRRFVELVEEVRG